MATVNKQSLREEFDALKGEFERLCASGKMAADSRALFQDMLIKRVFGLVIDFGTSQSPKSTQPLTTYLCPSRPGHQALRNNFASSLLLRT